ncbi:MAG: TraR/DksA family transcriptional regulator [Saprospiraceae bacterium]
MSQTTRYSDADLAIFKSHIEKLVEKGKEYLHLITEQVQDLNENKDSEGDWMDDTSSSSDLELLFTMQARQRKHLQDLENALLRIRNKSYGICIVTGELIDRRRLMAVPSTSRSLEAKMAGSAPVKKERVAPPKRTTPNQIISKVIKKKEPIEKSEMNDFEELEDDDLYDDMDDELDGEISEDFDFDSIAIED